MKIAIVGWGVEGQSAYRYFGPDHQYLIVNEQPNDSFPQDSNVKLQYLKDSTGYGLRGSVEDLSYLDGIEDYDKIIFTPISVLNLRKKFGDKKSFWKKAVTIQHIFFDEVKTKNIIGVTGTKGKGTTCTLITKLLEAEGYKVHLGGNIGVAVLDFINDVKPEDWVVLELANFQLKSLDKSPYIAVCLTISPEHLDWHPSFEDYVDTKANLFRYQTEDDIAIYYAENDYSKEIAGNSQGRKVPYSTSPGAYVRGDGMIAIGSPEVEIIPKSEVGLLGEHNLENICAALTAVQEAVGSLDNARTVLSNFKGLEHRLELVRTLDSVKYYDDSFGTNPQTAIVAVRALVQPVILITGGYDRGISMDPLIGEILKDRVRHVITIGQTGAKIAATLKEKGYKNLSSNLATLSDAVAEAHRLAEPGDAVLLSAAAASFDMFKNFEVRGNEFKKAVMAL